MDSIPHAFVDSVLLFNWSCCSRCRQLPSRWGMQATHLMRERTAVTLVLCHSSADRRCRYYYTYGCVFFEETFDSKLIFEEPRRFLVTDVRVVYNSKKDDEKGAILSDSDVKKVKQLLRCSAIPVEHLMIVHENVMRIEGAERISEALEAISCVRTLTYDFWDICQRPEIVRSGDHIVSKLLRSGNVEILRARSRHLSGQRQTEILNWMKSGRFKSFDCESDGTATYYDRYAEALFVDWLANDMPKDVELLVTRVPESLQNNTLAEMRKVERSWMRTEEGDIAYVLRRTNGEKRMIVLPAAYHYGIKYKELENDGRYDRMVEAAIMSDHEFENECYFSDSDSDFGSDSD